MNDLDLAKIHAAVSAMRDTLKTAGTSRDETWSAVVSLLMNCALSFEMTQDKVISGLRRICLSVLPHSEPTLAPEARSMCEIGDVLDAYQVGSDEGVAMLLWIVIRRLLELDPKMTREIFLKKMGDHWDEWHRFHRVTDAKASRPS